MSQTPPEQVVAANLAAYNARDLDGFMACCAATIEIWDQQTGTCLMQGWEQVRASYGELFARSPRLHSRIVRRSCVGCVVIDHEIVTGRYGGDLEILISYQVLAGRIARVWSSRVPLAQAITVRQARPDDAMAVAAIGRATYEEFFAHIWTPAGLQAHLDREFDTAGVAAELVSNGVSYFLAGSSDGVIGFAKLRYPRAMPLNGPVEASYSGAELQKIYMRSSALRRGIGVQLLDACVTRATELGYAMLWLDVLERNTQATCFYLRQGFKFAGKESFRTDRDREVMLVMTVALPK
jgi:ribosomal protein S18 acetylase RimI-like enzyme